MKFTPDIPTTPGCYFLKSSDHDEPMPVTLFMHGDPPNLLIETDEECCTLAYFVHDTAKCEWCRLVPAEELEKAWFEGQRDYQTGSHFHESRAKRVMDGEES